MRLCAARHHNLVFWPSDLSSIRNWLCREVDMRRLILVLGVTPLLIGTAIAAQPLTENQMDAVTGGFSAFSTADAAASIVPGVPSLTTQMQPICQLCFQGPIMQLGSGLNPFQSIGIVRPGLP